MTAASGPGTRGRSEFSCPSCRSYGCTYIHTGVPNALPAGISPLQGGEQLVTFFVGVEDLDATIAEVKRLGGSVVQEPARLPGVAFALIADPSGQVVGLAQQG
jgi:predicted enzyme related to lactoylglutathione lyase